jgi:phosphate uptake regulator
MWRRVADAYRDRSPEVYASLEADDEEIDELHTGLMRNSLPRVLRAPVLAEMALVARFLERLGDHAVEVCRWIVTAIRH